MSDTTPGAPAPAPRAWIAPLLSTLVTLPLAFVTFVFAGLSQMACDSCDGAVADRFQSSFETAWPVFLYGLMVPACLLLAGWFLPWEEHHTGRRRVVTVLAPLTVIGLYLVFQGLVDWPA